MRSSIKPAAWSNRPSSQRGWYDPEGFAMCTFDARSPKLLHHIRGHAADQRSAVWTTYSSQCPADTDEYMLELFILQRPPFVVLRQHLADGLKEVT